MGMNGWRKATAGCPLQAAAPAHPRPQALAISLDPNPTPDNPVLQSLKLDADLSILRLAGVGGVNRVGAPSGEQAREGREGGQLRAHQGLSPESRASYERTSECPDTRR